MSMKAEEKRVGSNLCPVSDIRKKQ